MEIHQNHYIQSPTQSHRYNDYYAQPYNNLGNDQAAFDFQQQHSMLISDTNPHQQIKSEHIKLESFGSPEENDMNTSPLQQSPSKMLSNTSPPSTSSPPLNAFASQQDKLSAFAFLQPGVGDSSTSLNLNYGFGSGSPLEHISLPTKGSSTPKHDRKRPYPCVTCSSRFGSKMELEEHQNSHTGQKPFECDICQSRFNRRSTLWNHKRIHSDAKPFSCTVCQMTFKWKNSLKCHKEMHARKNEATSMDDNDIKLLTYATAAKKKMAENSVNGLPPTAAIQTVASRKKPSSKKKVKRELQEHIVTSTMSANAVATSIPFSLFGSMDPTLSSRGLLTDQQLDGSSSHQHLAITHTSAQQPQLDFAQINQNNLIMQAIYSGSGSSNTNNSSSTNTAAQQQTQLSDEAFDLINGSHSAHTASGLGLDLLPTAQNQPFLLGEPKFNNDIASAVMQSANMQLPTNFPMNILDFQQQLTSGSRQSQQQLSYIHAQQQEAQQTSNLSLNQQQNLNPSNNNVLSYQQRELLLDDMLNYQQTALDPSLFLNNQQTHQQQAHHQTNMDQFADYMLNGNPVYPLSASQQQTDNTMAGSLHMQQQLQQQQMTLNQNVAFVNQQNGVALNANFPAAYMDDMQMSQEDLQHLAKMLPIDSKW